MTNLQTPSYSFVTLNLFQGPWPDVPNMMERDLQNRFGIVMRQYKAKP